MDVVYYVHMKKTLTLFSITLFLISLYIPTTSVQADTYMICAPYTRSLGYGSRGSDVSRLQNLLSNYYYLTPGSVTGYYGRLTREAVRNFQAGNGIPATGFVGSLTRNFMYRAECSLVESTSIPPVNNQAPVISSISPSSAAFGTTVTIYGSSFSRTGNNSINFAGVNNIRTGVVSNDGTSLQFVIPYSPCRQDNTPVPCPAIAYAPGTYPISVTTPNGTSNSVNFVATNYNDNTGSSRPVVNGVDGPTTLAINQQGTWGIRASDPNNRSLSYSVDWGDSQSYGYTTAASNSSYTQTATFSHSYSRSGYFTIRFTVRGDTGLTTESTITVYVSGTGSGVPTIYSLSPSSGPFGMPVTVTGTNFDRYNNTVNFAGVNNAYVNIPSIDGTTLRFTPTVTPCATGMYCPQVALNSGDYSVSVTNQYGTSNNLTYHAISNTGDGTEQTLALNQTGYFDNNVQLSPTNIIEDSRCPVNVNCIQAGRVVVETRVTTPASIGAYTLSVATDGGIYTLNNGSRIQITNVAPVKYSNQTTTSGEYRITYRVWRY